MPPTYRGPGAWDVWGSLRDGPPSGRWGHWPILRSGGRNGASSSSRNGAKRGRFGKTGAAVVRLGSCFASLLASRPLRMLWYEAWRVALMSNGRLRLGDWGVRVGGRWHRTVECTVQSAPSGGEPQSLLWGGIALPFDGNRSRSSEPCSGSPKVCPGLMRTLGWTRWERHSQGWSSRWPYKWPPRFRLWSPSLTQLGLSWL